MLSGQWLQQGGPFRRNHGPADLGGRDLPPREGRLQVLLQQYTYKLSTASEPPAHPRATFNKSSGELHLEQRHYKLSAASLLAIDTLTGSTEEP